MRALCMLPLLLLVAACTPADEQYCNGFGVGGTAEYGKCIHYYHEQQAMFDADRQVCELEADATYPPSLYDRGRYEQVMGGFGPNCSMYGGTTVRIEPDHYHNMEVDRLRMRIIEPCMQTKGWNSARNWQAGRQAVVKAPRPAAPVQGNGLPWLK